VTRLLLPPSWREHRPAEARLERSQTALLIEDLFRGPVPPGVFQTLLIPASKVAGIIEDERVRP